MKAVKLQKSMALLLTCVIAWGLFGCAQTPQDDPSGTTAPEVSVPPTTQEVTVPGTTAPEVTEPEVTEPEVTEPEVTEPEVTEPEVTEPEVTEPEVTEPEVTEPEVTEPQQPAGVEEPPQESGKYMVSKPEHLRYMQQHPDKTYALCNDIDLGGAVWEPIDNFTGTLIGKAYLDFKYTISNFTIAAAPTDANVGFFRVISGTVKQVNFEDVTITCSGTFSGNMGIVAGTTVTAATDVDVKNCTIRATVSNANVGLIYGKLGAGVKNSEAAGTLEVTLAGGTSYIGGGFGYGPFALTSNTIRTTVKVSGSGTTGAVGGVVGYFKGTASSCIFSGRLLVTADATFGAGSIAGQMDSGKLSTCYDAAQLVQVSGAAKASDYCGIQASGVTLSSCLVRDRNYTEAKLSDAEYAMRLQAVEYMYQMCTVRWSPSKTLIYDACKCANNHYQKFEAGKLYFGVPYTHRTGSLERFMYYLDENRQVVPSLNSSNFWHVMGADCADTIYWAWSQFSAQISFVQTNSAICTNGTIPVGNYQVANNKATRDTCKLNGREVMYEAYACVQPGDALLYGPGHIRMAAEAAYVFRNADGSINPSKSYILTHEQGTGCSGLDSKRTTCLTYGKYSFSSLFSGNYIPITIEAFGNGKADEIKVSTTNTNLTKTGLAQGVVSSNYRVNYVTVEIKDANGNVLLDRFGSNSVNDKHVTTYDLTQFQADVNALPLEIGKTYTYTVTACVGSREVEVQSFQFTA